MAKRLGTCSDCVHDPPTALTTVHQKTCSTACRGRRSRRIARQRKKQGSKGLPPAQQAMSDIIQGRTPDILRETIKEELVPLVREAITEDVMRAAASLVSMTPLMVSALHEDLQSSDKILRQRAYTLLAKFTLGNQSIAPQASAPSAQPMQVNFVLPRPGEDAEVTEVAATIVRECVECGANKPDDEFMGASDRCIECHEKVQAQVRERFGQ